MGEEELKKVESSEVVAPVAPVSEAEVPAPATPPPVEATKDVAEEKSVVPPVDDSKALSVVEKVPDTVEEKSIGGSSIDKTSSGGSIDRDIVLTRVETEKRLSLIKAWEDSEKTKTENKAHKKLSSVGSWENTKKATIEAQLKQFEEKLEKQRQAYAEKMKNKIAMIHKEAEDKKAMILAKKGEELLKAEEMAAKYRATNTAPKKLLGCF